MTISAEEDEPTIWQIPISISYPSDAKPSNSTLPQHWLTKETDDTFKAEAGKTYLINVDQAGYYRVNYGEENWKALTNILMLDATDKISPINRAQLIDDVLHMARTTKVNYTVALELVQYLSIEEDFLPWEAALKSLSYVYDRLDDNEETQELVQSFMISILGQRYANLEFETQDKDEHLDILGRRTASTWMCKVNYETCLTSAKAKFADFLTGKDIDPEIKDVVYQTGIRTGTKEDWHFMLEQFKKETVASEIKRFIFALAASEDEDVIQEYLQLTLDRDTIRLQDVIYVFRGIVGQRKGAVTAMTWLSDNFEDIMNDYGNADGLAGGGSISKYIPTIFSGTKNTFELKIRN